MQLKTLLRRPPITAVEEMSVDEAWRTMRRHGVRHLPVVRGRVPIGMLSERDLRRAGPSTVPSIRAYDLAKLAATETVAHVMSRDVVALPVETSVALAARLARARRADALVITDGGEVAGVLTRADLLAVLRGTLERREATGLGHLVVGASLRAGSGRALAEAVRLATVSDAKLTVLHVRDTTPWLASLEGATAEPIVWAERARRCMADEVDAVAPAGTGARMTFEVDEGVIAAALARRAAELDADLIVVGRADSRWPFALLETSVAAELLPLAPCPVLAVPGRRPTASQDEDPGR